jgi:surface polysaccharide O-acyltransferase-like enzyme
MTMQAICAGIFAILAADLLTQYRVSLTILVVAAWLFALAVFCLFRMYWDHRQYAKQMDAMNYGYAPTKIKVVSVRKDADLDSRVPRFTN